MAEEAYRVAVTPHVAVAVDESLCIVLDVKITDPWGVLSGARRYTITDVDALSAALYGAREHVAKQARHNVHTDETC